MEGQKSIYQELDITVRQLQNEDDGLSSNINSKKTILNDLKNQYDDLNLKYKELINNYSDKEKELNNKYYEMEKEKGKEYNV